jgi:hypothetical protein
VATCVRSLAGHVLCITLHNFHDEVFGALLGLSASDEVDRAEPVYALVLADNIDMATTAFLQIPNRLATSPND